MAILDVDRIYTFSQFSEFNQPPEEILAELGYDLQIEGLDLPRAKVVDSTVLQKSLERRIQLTPIDFS